MDRKIIFETLVGSHLYGTNRPDSDEDFMGIFLPSKEDLLGLQNCPTEWSKDEKISTGDRNTKGDIDRKYYSLQRFLNLAAEGQSKQLEMLFSPKSLWVTPSRPMNDEWSKILKNRELFVSKSAILPFIGFAKAQAYKAVVRGENLNTVRNILKLFEPLKVKHIPCGELQQHIKHSGAKIVITEGNMEAFEIAGRQYEFGMSIKNLQRKLENIEEKYGTRSEASAENGYDFKSLCHAYRLLFQAKELLTTGEMIFPRQKEEVKVLLDIRNGNYNADYFTEIEEKLTELREIKSDLPEKANYSKINELCQEIMYDHLFKEVLE